MKIFNKEIEDCSSCDYVDNYNFNQWRCSCTDNEINDPCGIEKDCPFNKEITKEDIESFGFTEIRKDEFSHNEESYEILTLIGYSNIAITALGNVIFDGQVTSKPHLEFILSSVGVPFNTNK